MSDMDILAQFADKLAEAGIVVDLIEADGVLHRCGTTDRPNSKNGAYKAHLDNPVSIWWNNWQTGDEGTWCVKSKRDMTKGELDVLQNRIARARAERNKENERRHKEAAERAWRIWSNAKPITAHPYLDRKGVPSHGLRLAWDGRLIVPVMDGAGKITSLQFIKPDGDKRFLAGGKTGGGFFSIPASEEETAGPEAGPLLIAEGYATATSLHMGTEYGVLVAFNAGNLKQVAKLARAMHPDREIILCADNDAKNENNPGLTKAKEAARAAGVKLAACPALEDGTDFNDLHKSRGLEAVKAVVDSARKEQDYTMPPGFYMIPTGPKAGLYYTKLQPSGESEEMRLGPPLYVRGMTRDTDSASWGLLLEWADPDGKGHQWAMPAGLIFKEKADWFSQLADGGWLGVPPLKKPLARFLSEVRPPKRVRCVPSVGWHGNVFMLPDAVYGETGGEEVVLQSSTHAKLYGTFGTLEGWQEVARLAAGNSRFTLALCAAFAGPLLHMAGLESGGFNFVGGSSTGKTTALRLAASVWDGPSYVRSWRATDNALESVAALHNDTLLILDELGQASPKTVSECAYMLTNGQGKARANREGNAKKSHTWRLLFLSSGEGGLADKLSEIGLKPRAGQEVRLVDIEADAGAGFGAYDNIHGFATYSDISAHIQKQAAQHFGHAGRAFLEAITDGTTTTVDIRASVADVTDRICPANADGQVRRVALRFAVCAVAGHCAVAAGILPATIDPAEAVTRCFTDWLTARGGTGAAEDTAILAAVRLFLEQHGAGRFEDMDAQAASRVLNRVGFKRAEGGRIEFIILPESFKAEVVKGFNTSRAARVLAAAGWLRRGESDRLTCKVTLPDMGRASCYVIAPPQEA